MSVTPQEVRKVAKLASLAVTDQEVEQLCGELNKILAHIDRLSQVDTEGVKPMHSPLDLDTPLRPDLVTAAETLAEYRTQGYQQNQPASEGRFFKVPQIKKAN